jgi:hypothetical protein
MYLGGGATVSFAPVVPWAKAGPGQWMDPNSKILIWHHSGNTHRLCVAPAARFRAWRGVRGYNWSHWCMCKCSQSQTLITYTITRKLSLNTYLQAYRHLEFNDTAPFCKDVSQVSRKGHMNRCILKVLLLGKFVSTAKQQLCTLPPQMIVRCTLGA